MTRSLALELAALIAQVLAKCILIIRSIASCFYDIFNVYNVYMSRLSSLFYVSCHYDS